MKKNDINALLQCCLFVSSDEKLIFHLLASGKYDIKTYLKGERLFSTGSHYNHIAIILKGCCEVSKIVGKGTLYISDLTEGKIAGMSCLFNENGTFPTFVTAKENTRVLIITKEQLMSLFSLYPEILERYLSLLSKKICFLNEKIQSISAPDVKEALRSYLLDTSEKLSTSTFSLPVSVQKLSSMLNVGRTSLYRAFDELTEENFLTKNGKVITITERKNIQ